MVALVRGQQNACCSSAEALESGAARREILTDGLVRGMTILGEDFSANRAFVPEMLIAARCMAAATELLKPYMMGESSETIGRVCLGTVRGDMHDIGKKPRQDHDGGQRTGGRRPGVDVTAKQFVDTAIEQHCDIIACSSLLTTTMPEMRDVVELAKARGIRDRVKIFVGGAPITPGSAMRSVRTSTARTRPRPRARPWRCCAARKRIKDIMQECVSAGRTYAGRRHFHFLGSKFGEMDREKSKGRNYFRFLNNCFSVPPDL